MGSCVSCNQLVKDHEGITLSKRMKKVSDVNSQFGKLLAFLNSSAYLSRGHSPVTSLSGHVMCHYCRDSLYKGNMPRVSIANNLDPGVAPEPLQGLNTFELLLLRRVNMFQSTVVLGPSGGHLKRSEKMRAMKGFCVHIPMPVEDTVVQLQKLRPGQLVDPDKTIQVLGVPNKDKWVWNQLVKIDKVYNALVWYTKNNPLYSDVVLPANPDDLLPKFDIDPASQPTSPAAATQASQGMMDLLANLGKDSSDESDLVSCSVFDQTDSDSDQSFVTIDQDGADSDDEDQFDPFLATVDYDSWRTNFPSDEESFITADHTSSTPPTDNEEEDVEDSQLTVVSKISGSGGKTSYAVNFRSGDGSTHDRETGKEVLGRKLLEVLRQLTAYDTVCKECTKILKFQRAHLVRLGTKLVSEVALRKRLNKAGALLEAAKVPYSSKDQNGTACRACNGKNGSLAVNKTVAKTPELQEQNWSVYNDLVDVRTQLDEILDVGVEIHVLCTVCAHDPVQGYNIVTGDQKFSPLTTAVSKLTQALENSKDRIVAIADQLESSKCGVCMSCGITIFDAFLVQQYPDIAPWINTNPSSLSHDTEFLEGTVIVEEMGAAVDNKRVVEDLLATWGCSMIRDSICGNRCRTVLNGLLEQLRGVRDDRIFRNSHLESEFLNHMLADVILRLENFHQFCFMCSIAPHYISTCNRTPTSDSSCLLNIKAGGQQSGVGSEADLQSSGESSPNSNSHGQGVVSDFSSISGSDSSQGGKLKTASRAKKLLRKLSKADIDHRIEEMTFTNLDAILESSLDDLYELLKVDSTPLQSSDKRIELLSFPELFCYGQGGLHDDRPGKCGPAKYNRAKLLSGDSRFRHNLQYVFYLAGEQFRRKISASVYGALRNVHGLEKLTSGELLRKIKGNDPDIKRRLTAGLRDVPGTKQYWTSVKSKLRAQTEKFGPPTFFMTFSPAEYAWPELIGQLRELNKDLPGIDSLSDSELLNKEPAVTSEFIHNKFAALLEFIKEGKPFGKVKSYFIRYEYQSRGTVHFHCLFWVEGAPVIGESSDEEVAAFIQKYITCRLPDKDLEPDLYQIVNKFQQHSCRKYCLRSVKTSSKGQSCFHLECRFGFPLPATQELILRDVLSSLVGKFTHQFKKRLYDLPRSFEERNINAYNPVCSLLWGANMDIQFVAENTFAIPEYVCKYLLKVEVSNINIDFSSLYEDTSGTAFQKYMKVAYAFLKQREMSANEACDLMLLKGGQLWTSSEKYLWVPTTLPEQRSRTLRKVSELEQDESSTNLFYADFVHDFYPNRWSKDEFLNLFRFVSKYERAYGSNGSPISVKGKVIGRLKERKREPVVYHHQYNVNKSPELFYYSMLSFLKPWKTEGDILGTSKTYKEEFFRCVDDQNSIYDDLRLYSRRKIDIEKARTEMIDKVAVAVENAKDRSKDPKVAKANSEDENEDEDENKDDNDNSGVDSALAQHQQTSSESGIKTQEDLDAYVATLNADQLKVYNKVTSALSHMFDHNSGKCTNDDCTGQLLLYVSGFGGTGKSYLISGLNGYCYVQREVYKRDLGSLLMAPTGVAALNIGGQTIHSVLSIPVEHGHTPKYTAYKSDKLHRTRQGLSDVKCVILDEVSMISNVMLLYISMRLSEIFKGQPNGNLPFGGRCVILFGDLLQLQPVQAAHPFVEVSGQQVQKLTGGVPFAQNLWRLFEYAELNINQRQKSSSGQGHEWKELLSRLRVGGMTADDVKLLSSRLIELSDDEDPRKRREQVVRYFIDLVKKNPKAVCLLPTKAMVTEFNEAILSIQGTKTFSVPAIDDIKPCQPAKRKRIEQAIKKLDKKDDARNTAALEHQLCVGEEVRVMLRKNLDVKIGLVNGSMGTVEKIHFTPGSKLVEKISIKFDDIKEVQQITRDRREIQVFSEGFFFRSQFPITLSYSFTIHKSQGLTLDVVLTDVGNALFAPGQMYVCLSRLRSIDGLHLINFSSKKGAASVAALKEYARISSAQIYMPKAPKSVFKLGKTIPQRHWSTNKNAVRKAKDAVQEAVLDAVTKSNTQTRPKGKDKAPTRKDPVKRILSWAKRKRNPPFSLERISTSDLRSLYSNTITPGLSGALEGFHNKLVQELNPDPFNEARSNDKWLSDDVLQQYLWEIIDRVECTGAADYSFYSMAACFDAFRHARLSAGDGIRDLPLSQLSDDHYRQKILPVYIRQRYMHRRWSSTRVITGSADDRMVADGDPMDHDIIALIGNPSGHHWILIVIDNRPQHKSVSYYDSGLYSPNDVTDRCLYYLKGLQLFRQVLSSQGVQLRPVSVDLTTHSVRDGGSVKQKNSFDCGVFAILNLELYLAGLPANTISQGKLPLLRASILARMLQFERQKL